MALTDPAKASRLFKSLKVDCSWDFERVCLDPRIGLHSANDFAGPHHKLPYDVLPGVDKTIFGHARGNGRWTIQKIRSLYIDDSVSAEMSCLVHHSDELDGSCRDLVLGSLPANALTTSPPTHGHHHVGFWLLISALVIFSFRRKQAARDKINRLLEGLHQDVELRVQVEERLGVEVPAPIECRSPQIKAYVGKALLVLVAAIFVLVWSLEVTAMYVYQRDLHGLHGAYAFAYVLHWVWLQFAATLALRHYDMPKMSYAVPAAVAWAGIMLEFSDYESNEATSTAMAMLIWFLVASTKGVIVFALGYFTQWAHERVQAYRHSRAPSAPEAQDMYSPLLTSEEGLARVAPAPGTKMVHAVDVTFAVPPSYL